MNGLQCVLVFVFVLGYVFVNAVYYRRVLLRYDDMCLI